MEEQKISNSIFDQAKKYIPTYLNLNQTPMAELPFISRGRDSLINNGIAPVIKDIDILPFPERKKFWGIPESEKKTWMFLILIL